MDVRGRVLSGTRTESEARLHGRRRYESREGQVRAKQDARAESNAWSTTPGKEELELCREQQPSYRGCQNRIISEGISGQGVG